MYIYFLYLSTRCFSVFIFYFLHIPLDNYALFTKVNCRRATALFNQTTPTWRRAINNIIDSVRRHIGKMAGNGKGDEEGPTSGTLKC